uniref:Peptidase S1 domain-containing protein n=1 Tax=Tetradesmus obliquus TaxID=3088 RepID=A0A383WA69_TETOB|eukprot:jgi/Sobl393_1/3531/SZX74351.1
MRRSLASASTLCAVLLAAALLCAAASGQPRRLLQEEYVTESPAYNIEHVAAVASAAPAAAGTAPLQVSQPSPDEAFELPAGFDATRFVYRSATRRGAIKGAAAADVAVTNARRRAVHPTAATAAPGSPEAQAATAAVAVATEASAVTSTADALPASTNTTKDQIVAASSGVNPSAWCPNPTSSYASSAESYEACVILARQSNGARIPWCTAFFVTSPGSKSNIALTAGHCVSDSKNTFTLDNRNYGVDKESIICCAYDRAVDQSKGSQGYCPQSASYKILNYKLYSSYHNGGRRSHDMAVVATANAIGPTGGEIIPGKWAVDNWDGAASGKRDWWVYGYPQYDDRYSTCKRDFYGRRWSWGVSGPVINQPSSSAASYMYGNSCGGLSGAPVYDGTRRAITSVLVASDINCDASGWGRISTTAIRGYPSGRTHLKDAWSGVDVYSLWQGL